MKFRTGRLLGSFRRGGAAGSVVPSGVGGWGVGSGEEGLNSLVRKCDARLLRWVDMGAD